MSDVKEATKAAAVIGVTVGTSQAVVALALPTIQAQTATIVYGVGSIMSPIIAPLISFSVAPFASVALPVAAIGGEGYYVAKKVNN